VERIPLATAISDTLFAFTPNAVVIECPARMSVGSVEHVRLTAIENLTDTLRKLLQEKGVPAESLMGLVVLVVADLKPADDAFATQRENRTDGTSPNTWGWQLEARKPGNHKLEAVVTLSAEIPSGGSVAAKPVVFTRLIEVQASPTSPAGDFWDRYTLVILESVAVLVGTWLAWMLWRTRRSSFSHR
jgi:hypothetical protein